MIVVIDRERLKEILRDVIRDLNRVLVACEQADKFGYDDRFLKTIAINNLSGITSRILEIFRCLGEEE